MSQYIFYILPMRFFYLTLSFAVFCLMSQEVEEIIVTGAINDEVDK